MLIKIGPMTLALGKEDVKETQAVIAKEVKKEPRELKIRPAGTPSVFPYQVNTFIVNTEPLENGRIPEGTLGFATVLDPQDKTTKFLHLTHGNVQLNATWGTAGSFRQATRDEINARLEAVRTYEREVLSQEWLKEGKQVRLRNDIVLTEKFLFFEKMTVVRAGIRAIIEYNPLASQKILVDGLNSDSKRDGEGHLSVRLGAYRANQLIEQPVRIYFTDTDIEKSVDPRNLEPYVFDDSLVNSLVLPDKHLKTILNLSTRVLKPDVTENVYKHLGLERICQKGRGAVFLLFGPAGTGKTMTAEALAEKLRLPLLRTHLGVSHSEGIQEALEAAFARAMRYNAILLLDEVDILIRKRQGHAIFDEMTTGFLRCLEYYPGILIMTTNMVNEIDPAIFSRVHACLSYDISTEEDRTAIWRAMLTKEVLGSIRGQEEDIEKMIAELARVKINGREIKTVIQNAVTRAACDVSGDIPKVRWINRSYFLEEATRLAEQREELKK